MSEANRPAWRTVYRDLKARIGSGELPPGAALPTQSEIAQHYDVRRAIAALVDEQLVTSWQGKGAIVSEARIGYKISDRTRFGDNIRQFGRRGDTRLVGARRRPTADPVAGLLGVRPRDPVLIGEMLRLVDGRPAMLAYHHYDPRRFPTILDDIERTGSVTKAFEGLGVGDYLRAETIVETRLPTATEAAALEIPPSQPVFVVTGQNVDAEGRPLEVSQSISSGDRIRFFI